MIQFSTKSVDNSNTSYSPIQKQKWRTIFEPLHDAHVQEWQFYLYGHDNYFRYSYFYD